MSVPDTTRDDAGRLARGLQLYKEGKLEAALAMFDTIEDKELSLAKHYHKGLALAKLGHLEASLVAFREIKEIPARVKGFNSGSFLQAYYASVAAVLHQLAKTKGVNYLHDAISCYEYALELCGTDPRLLLGLGAAYMDLGLHGEAVPYLEKVVAIDPASSEAKEALVLARHHVGAP
jgi:tetratricopeptide (TPR) repeat protein